MLPSLPKVTAGLLAHASDDLANVWRGAKTVGSAERVLFATIPVLAERYGSAASVMAAEWYDANRASLSVPGRFRSTPAQLGDLGINPLVGWATQPLLGDSPDWAGAQTRLEGGFMRRISDVARNTVMGSSLRDPQSHGWQRVGAGGCDFCLMLISRGAVYSKQGSTFASHDHCHCSAVPAFGGYPLPVKPYTPSAVRISDAGRARVRDYLATH